MFNVFRSRNTGVRIMLGVLLGMVSIAMLWYLIPTSWTGTANPGQDTVAVIGDQKITTQDVNQRLQMFASQQPNMPKMLMALYAPMVVNSMIEEKAMAYEARRLGLQVSDEDLSNEIQAKFAPQMGGSFNPDIYNMFVTRQLNMTVPNFEAQEREEMLVQRLESLEGQSIVVTDAEARAEYQRKNLKVGLEYIDFDEKDFRGKVSKDPAAIQAYFNSHRTLFRTPEKRDAVLVVGSVADFAPLVKVSDADLHQAYKDNIDSYQLPERVRARHILIKTQGKPKEDAPKAKAKAEDILNQLKHGANFADLAKKDSEDPGSAVNGGELGWLVHGQTVPNFDKEVFSLQPGQLSPVIETEYGYHIIQVEEKQAAHTQSFDEVKAQLLGDLQKQQAGEELNKAMDAAHAEIAKNPGQADAIAQKYHLHVFHVNGVTSNGTLPDASQPQVVNAIFTASKGAVTDVIRLDAQNKDAFAIVQNIVPAQNADFKDVQAEVEQKYTQAEASRLAQDAAKAAAERAKKGESLEAIANSNGLTVKTAAPFTIDGAAEGIGSGSLLAQAFKSKVGDIVGPVAAQDGQFVCRVSQEIPADMTQFAQNRAGVVQELTQRKQQVQGPLFRESILRALEAKHKIKRNQDAIDRIVQSYRA